MDAHIIDYGKLKQTEAEWRCVFGDDGIYAEMILDLSEYAERTQPIDSVRFGFYSGNSSGIKSVVALVDEDWVQYFDRESRIFCGFIGDEPVSFCTVDYDTDCILELHGERVGGIGCVGTVPQYRRQGIGLRMVDLATAYLKKEGFDKSYIHYTHIDKWYAKLGYQTFARFSFLQK